MVWEVRNRLAGPWSIEEIRKSDADLGRQRTNYRVWTNNSVLAYLRDVVLIHST